MSLKELQTDITFQTVKNFRKSLAERKKYLLSDDKILLELFDSNDFLVKFEDFVIETRSTAAAKELSKNDRGGKKNVINDSRGKMIFHIL